MTGTRYRLVTVHDSGEEHVSSRVLAYKEIPRELQLELLLHREAGWEVGELDGPWPARRAIVVRRGHRRRHISARPFDPMDDDLCR